MEAKLDSISISSWLVRGQIEVKMGKLMPIGGLRGAELELNKVLKTPKER